MTNTENMADEMPSGLNIELSFIPCYNLSLQQNAFPVVHELLLKNNTGRDLRKLKCEFSSEPAFLRPKTIEIEELKNEEVLPLHDLPLELDYKFFSELSDALKGKLCLVIRNAGEVLFCNDFDVDAFAPDQWLGSSVMPELLASFVTPNLEVINQLQSVVADELKHATGDPSIQGYQSNKTRVYETCAAIYRAIHSWGIHYSNPASSFGVPGQRIRFADTIYQYRLATCLDTSILFASVMEQCGLHPVILLQEGHAYIGCHLIERYFPDIPMDDLQTIRKLVDLDEFLILETTLVTSDATFSKAETVARSNHLNIENDFKCAIDIVRARHSGIRPLPLMRGINGMEFLPPDRHVNDLGKEQKRKLQKELDISKLKNKNTDNGRVERWSQKLLDLSLRNRLLNVRDTKLTIPIACPDIEILEDKMAADETLSLNPLGNLLNEKDLHDLAMLRNCKIKTDIKLLLEKELMQHRLWTNLEPPEMQRRLTGLYRQSKTDLEEGGVNTLFLAIGFLEWKPSEREKKSYLAPILLIPIRLQRKSMTEGIRITRLDEDTIINETLLELLRSQFKLTIPGISPLPMDKSGVDAAMVMQIFRQTIKDMKGWEVREEVCLGHFSFGKFVMWTDMTARLDALKKNPVINYLIQGGGLFDDGIKVFSPDEIETQLKLDSLYCPMSADSSQLTAVLYSQKGKNFVLHGPPGTGKSQTITNIIAHNLVLGRRVLFVSEKKAALDVVHKRLSAIGLRPFCLELHSNKSGKTEVLSQFNEALKVQETPISDEWVNTIQSMEQIRAGLNEYVAALHKRYPNGLSAYDCFSRMLKIDSALPEHLLKMNFLHQTSKERQQLEQLVEELRNAWQGTSQKAIQALHFLSSLDWSPVIEKNLLKAADELLDSVPPLMANTERFRHILGMPETQSPDQIFRTAFLMQTILDSGNIPAAFFEGDLPEQIAFLRTFAENARNEQELQEKLRNYHLEILENMDFSGIADRIRQNSQAFFPVRYFKNRLLLKELAGLKKLGASTLTIEELNNLLPDAERLVSIHKTVSQTQDKAKILLGKLWNEGNVDWTFLETVFTHAKEILEQVDAIAGNSADIRKQILEKLQQIMPEVEIQYRKGTEEHNKVKSLIQAWNIYQEKLQAFELYSDTFSDLTNLHDMSEKLQTVKNLSAELRGIMLYRKSLKQAETAGIGGFVKAMEDGLIDLNHIPEVFRNVYGREMLNQILMTAPVLCNFTGIIQEQRIQKFRELDEKYTALTRNIIFAKLASALPRRRSGPCPEGTELGILKRECEKRARQKPVRQLLEQIPTLAPVLKPCFLMSPLSVAQYLPPDTAPFDLIVFDEASQIPVWDAIGVIARGKQLIVVGDPKQMPPTNFFQKGESEDNELQTDTPEDMESILDECIASGLYSAHLNWHYRSRHESLISFSNHYYYEDKLYTFPAARSSENLGISFKFVPNGVYDRTMTRTNLPEAKALVKYIFEQLENSKRRSIGVVTFSQAQKDLIEDLMEQERLRHPNLETYFNNQNEEALFVKNLENVQGDERDLILFSIGYAPDAEGKFSMNFGPLNRKGGERRLNVAITRAKEQIVVFSSIHAQQIDLKRTSATGAAHLKYFLDYAEKGFHIQMKNMNEEQSEGLVDTIANFLAENGFQLERNVGCSGHRIDLAVRHPEHPDDFFLGIECDGPAYAAQKTVRDRDHLRDTVLHSLNWHTYRAWSVDWVYDRKRSEEGLLNLLESLRNTPENTFAESPEKDKETQVSDEVIPENVPPPEPAQCTQHCKPYFTWKSSQILFQEQFYELSSKSFIQKQMREIIQCEGPIYESLLRKRIMRAWGFTRSGDNIQTVLNSSLPVGFEYTQNCADRVFWPSGLSAADYRDYRISANGEIRRKLEEIPPEEIANAMCEVLMDFHSCEQETLYRETVKLFGFSAVTTKAKKYLDCALNVLKHSGRI